MRKTILSVFTGLLLIGMLAACTPGAASLAAGVSQPVSAQAPAPQPAQATQVVPPTPNTNVPASRTISVSGSGKVTLTPDIAYVNIGVHSEANDAKTALSQNTALVTKVMTAIKGVGIDAKDIQTTNFNIYPVNQYSQTGQITSTKYDVDNTVYVTVRKLDVIGSLLDTVVTSGANNINGITFDVADKAAATSDARKQAVQDARTQAEQMAAAAGVKLGDIQSINLVTNTQPIPFNQSFGKGGGAPVAADAQVPVSSGELILTADVTITYAIQ